MDKLNTHYYDGKLVEIRNEVLELLEKSSGIEFSQKLADLNKLLQYNFSANAKKVLNILINDYRKFSVLPRTVIKKDPNHSQQDNLHAENILWLCYKLLDSVSNGESSDIFDNVLKVLDLQLVDMLTGMCPQGRCTRLLQIIHAFKYYITL